MHKFYLTEHLAYHSGERRFQCSTCGKKFSSSSALSKHSARHTSSRAHKCSLCDKAFVVKHDLTAHVKTVHERTRDDAPAVFRAGVAPVRDPGSGALAVPPNYVESVESGVGEGTGYEKPRPALRPVSELSEDKDSTIARENQHSLPTKAQSEQQLQQQQLEKQQQLQREREEHQKHLIEDWMIAQGVTFGQTSETELMMQQQQQQHANHIQLKIPNVDNLRCVIEVYT